MNRNRVFALLLAALALCAAAAAALEPDEEAALYPEGHRRAMTLEEKVGQLFIIRPDALDVTLTPDEINDSKAAGVKALTPEMKRTLRQYPPGGFALFSSPGRKAAADPPASRQAFWAV